jgi:hypothetical protein
MPREARRRDRLAALFVVAVILFNPPVLWLFAGQTLFDWPLLFIYLFCAWGVVVALIALTIEHKRMT